MCRAGKDEFYFTALLAWKMSFSTLGVKISSGNPKECPGFLGQDGQDGWTVAQPPEKAIAIVQSHRQKLKSHRRNSLSQFQKKRGAEISYGFPVMAFAIVFATVRLPPQACGHHHITRFLTMRLCLCSLAGSNLDSFSFN